MSEQHRTSSKTQHPRRRLLAGPALSFGVAAIGLALTLAPGNTLAERGGLAMETAVAALAAEAEPTPDATADALDQPGAIPTVQPDLPSLSQEPVAISLAFDAAMNAGDVDALLNLFNDGAEVKIPPDIYDGANQIRNWATYLAANHFASEPGLRRVNKESITWPAEVRSDQLVRFGLDSLDGDATLRTSGGKIDNYTFVLTRESASRLRAAQIAASEILQDPLVVGADLANVYGPTDVFRGTDGVLISYRDMVAAEPGSGPYYDLGGEPVVLRTGL